jgi:hypothetical protein
MRWKTHGVLGGSRASLPGDAATTITPVPEKRILVYDILGVESDCRAEMGFNRIGKNWVHG